MIAYSLGNYICADNNDTSISEELLKFDDLITGNGVVIEEIASNLFDQLLVLLETEDGTTYHQIRCFTLRGDSIIRTVVLEILINGLLLSITKNLSFDGCSSDGCWQH